MSEFQDIGSGAMLGQLASGFCDQVKAIRRYYGTVQVLYDRAKSDLRATIEADGLRAAMVAAEEEAAEAQRKICVFESELKSVEGRAISAEAKIVEAEQRAKISMHKLGECIIRWWHWLQNTEETDSASSAGAAGRPTQNMENQKDMHGKMKEGAGNCPVCRKPFHAKDLEHVLDLVGSHSSSQSSLDSKLPTGDEKLLVFESEITRRLKFEAILKLQENSGLIEPKRDLVVLPGMFLPQPVATSTKESDEQQEKDPSAVASGKHVSGNSNGPSSSGHRNFGARKQRVRSDHHSRGHSSRKPVQQWVRKENANGK